MGTATEAAFVAAIQAGDEEAALDFCATFIPRLRAFAHSRHIPPQDAESLIQDILVAALDQLRAGRFRGDARLGTWVYAIANAKAVDHWRRTDASERLVPLERVTADATAHAIDPHHDDVLAVQEALAHLAPEDRFVLWLHDAEGATLEEIGRRIGRKKSAVAERLIHARDRFRRAFGQDTGKNPMKPRLKE